MENSILNQIPFDPAYIIAGLLILVVLLLILTITTMTKVRRLDRQYDYFMRGKMQKLWKMSFWTRLKKSGI